MHELEVGLQRIVTFKMCCSINTEVTFESKFCINNELPLGTRQFYFPNEPACV